MRAKLYTIKIFGFTLRTMIILLLTGLFGLVALGLDLDNDGLIDQVLWEITGETEPAAQILGGVQYLSNYTRETPKLAEDTPVSYVPDNPFGINAFLEQEVEEENRERSMQLITDAGFGWLRQQVPWEDIEIDEKGDFIDRRSDRNFDGVIDEADYISSWDKYDNIVDLAEEYDIEILARIGGPTPEWALNEGMAPEGPPADIQDFVDFAIILAERYQGRIQYYQVWNEPNLFPEWGNQNINPAAYADLLCRTHDALKAVDPNIIVVTGAIGPTIDHSGVNAYDVLFLEKLYDEGGGDCFDILGAQGYGLFSGPTDQRLRPFTVNYGRNQWLRDVMVVNGDAHKPIWISEAAWNPVPNDPSIADLERFGRVTPEQAAEWAPIAYERAINEWEWVGVVNYWFLRRPNENEINQSWYYFRLVDPDWTPTPTYYALQDYIQSGDWKEPEEAWPDKSRRQVPVILTLGVGLLFLGFIFINAVFDRLFPRPDEDLNS